MMDTDTPKITRRLILFLATLTTSAALYAQTCKPVNGVCPTITGVTCSFAANIEKGCNCYDGIDNDNDGQKDAQDLDCAAYLTTYVGSGSTCTLPPPGGGGSIFTGVADVASASQNTADTPAHIAVGDMNGDGVPDAVVTSKFNRTIQVVATAKVTKCAAPVGGVCASSNCTFASNIEKGCNCYDGIDNDGDGKIDMADIECSSMGSWKAGDIMSDYKTQSSNIFPSGGGGEWVFEHEMTIADIDGNGIGEMYTIASRRGSGNSGANDPPTEFALVGFTFVSGNGNLVPLFNGISLGPNRPGNPGIADFDGDGKAEVYIRNQIYAAESGFKLADPGGDWKTAINTGSVAVDMDGDGKLELVCGNFIYKMPAAGFSARTTLQTMVVYKDMNVDFPAQKFYPKGYNDVNEYSITQASTTSVADFDVDGYPDVFITGAINCSGNEASPCGTNKTTIFYWNVHNGTLKTFFPPDAAYPLGWVWGTGRVNLYDAYPNHEGLEALFMAGKSLYCLDNSSFNTGTALWVRNTPNDALSGILSLTCYDFDNDGNIEVVYRDTQSLNVCDGKTGQSTIWTTTCQSHTMTEGPIIADVNGDGATDICITCYSNVNAFDISKSTPQQQSLGQIHLYYTNSSTWLPTRKVWNQHPYFVVNINDNLTLPTSQINQSLIFGNGACPNGVQGPQRPLNLFMDQVPHLSASGCPEFPAPDITFYGDTPATGCGAVGGSSPPAGCDTNGDGKYLPTVVITPPICGNLGISAYFNIQNNGDLAISDNIPVSFFNGDPTANPVTATKLYSATMNVTNLGIGGTFTSPTYNFNGPGNTFTLYVVIYNDGTSLPITLTGSSTKECSISNNMYSTVIAPSPFTVTTEVVQNNLNCPPYLVGNNGQVRSRIFIGATEQVDYSPYAFQWYDASQNPIAGATLYNLSNLDQGTYYVRVVNTQKGCAGNLVPVTVTRANPAFPAFTFTNVSEQTICSPANGERIISAADGSIGYTYTWLDLALNPIGVTGADAKNLVAGTYSVQIQKGTCTCKDPVTGGPCAQTSVSGPQYPDASATKLTDVVDCQNPNSGSVTASALLGAVAQNPANYTFTWYYYNSATNTRGSILPVANGTGETRTGLAAGSYQVVITDNVTKCAATTSPTATVNTSTVLPTANIVQLAPQTSCDTNQPNGILTATGTAAGYTSPTDFKFEWFRGDNTLAANLIPIAGGPETVSGTKGEQLNKAKGGGVIYTVRVTTPLNCQATFKLPLTETIIQPVVTLSQTPNDICDPAKTSPSVLYDGTVTATVTFNGTTVTIPDPNYNFNWYDGTTTTTAHNPATTTTATITGLQDNKYFTVVANRNDLHCSSVPQNIMVQKTSVQPILQATSTGSNNCDPALTPDGTATVNIITNPLPAGHTYTYQWYEIDPVSGATISTLGAANTGTAQTATKLGGPYNPNKRYMVDVIDKTNGCENTTTQSVSDVSVVPVLAITTSPNSICAPATSFNGSVTASLTNPVGAYVYPTDFSFSWYNTNTNNPANLIAGPNTTSDLVAKTITLNKLDVGDYAVVGKNTKTGCVSSVYTDKVITAKILPLLLPGATGSNNCDQNLTPDGTATYTVTNMAQASVTQQWYVGQGDPTLGGMTALLAANNGNQVTAIKVGGPDKPAGSAPHKYTVLVTNTATGCANYTTASVPDNSVVPVLGTSVTPNSVCDLTLGFKGTFTATLTNPVGSYVFPTDFTFVWKDQLGAVINPAAPPTTSPYTSVGAGSITLNNLDTNPFTVIGTNTKTGCVSAPAGNTVPNNKVYPSLLPLSTPSNNCVADGTIVNLVTVRSDGTAGVTASGTPGGYNYQWFNGQIDLTDYPAPNNHAADKRVTVDATTSALANVGGPGGAQYTAYVVDQGTGCSAFVTASVADNSSKPILGTSTTPNDICSPASALVGTMTASLANAQVKGTFPNDYTFTWSVGPPVTGNATLTKLDAGSYTVTATNNKTGCVSPVATDQVLDQKTNPVLTFPPTLGSHNCDPSITPDGSAEVDVAAQGPGGADAFTFAWTPQAGAPAGTSGAPTNTPLTSTIKNVGGPNAGSPGTPFGYNVKVTNSRTGCFTNGQAQVQDISAKPTLTVQPFDNSICVPSVANPYNGHVDKTSITNNIAAGYGGTVTYQYTWTDVTAPVVAPHPIASQANTATASYTKLPAGDYSGVVKIVELGCISNPAIVSVKDIPVYPAFNVTPQPATNCPAGPNNGGVSATITNAGGNTFTFAWRKGILISDPPVASSDLATSTSISNQQGGKNYTVFATNNQTGCAGNYTQTIADNSLAPVLSPTAFDNSICTAGLGFNGKVTSTFTDTNGPADPHSYSWYLGSSALPANLIAGQSGATLTGRDGNLFYTGTITNTTLGCTSAPVTVFIKNSPVYPAFSSNPTPSTNCAPTADNGQIDVTISNAAPGETFTFAWHKSLIGDPAPPGGPPVNTATTTSISGQEGGKDYLLQATNDQTGCSNTFTQTLADNHVLPLVTLVSTQNDVCNLAVSGIGTAANYSGTVTATVTNPSGNTYFYSWSNAVSGTGTNQIINLNANNYTVTAKDNVTGCISALANINVTDNLVKPAATSSFTASTTCATAPTPNGIVAITGITSPLGKTYDFKWYDGSTAGVGGVKPSTNTATTSTYNNVQGGAGLFYTALITVQETGCQSSVSLAVPDQSVVPVLGPLTATDNTFCVGSNGTASLGTLSDTNGTPSGAQSAPYVGYTFTWSNAVSGNYAAAGTITGLALGTYSVTATNTALSCTSAPVSVNVNNDKFIPVIDITQVQQTSCDTSAPNGSLEATVNETTKTGGAGAGVRNGYHFTWTDAVTSATYTFNYPPTPVATLAKIIGQKGNQNYSINVIDPTTQCQATQTVWLNQTLTNPTVTTLVTDLTICSPPNGNIVATGAGTAGPYTYFWWDGSSAPDEATIIAQNNNPVSLSGTTAGNAYNTLVPGTYTVVAQDNITKCYSSQLISNLTDASPAIVIAITDVSLPTTCVSTNSQMSATANGVTAGYLFNWYYQLPSATDPSKGSINYFTNPPVFQTPPYTNPLVLPATSPIFSTPVVIGLPSDLYTLEVTNNVAAGTAGYGCKAYQAHTLPFQNSHAVLKITKTNSTLCPYTAGNGSITIEIDNPTSPVPYFAEAGTITASVVSTAVVGVGTSFLTALKPGDEIVDAANTLIGTVLSVTDNFNLTLTAVAGVNVVGGAYKKTVNQRDYNVFLYEGGPAIPTALSPTNRTTSISAPFMVSSSLKPDTYIVGVQETYSGSSCFIYQDVIIGADALPPVISLASTIKQNDACGAANFDGRIDLAVAEDPNEDAASVGVVTYTINMNAALFQPAGTAAGTYPATPLAPGNYTFDVTASTGCTATKTFAIQDNPVVAQLLSNDILVNNAEYCTASLEKSAKVTVNNIKLSDGVTNEDITEYQFKWLNSASATVLTGLGDPTNSPPAGAPAGGDELSNQNPAIVPGPGIVVADTYALTVTKMSDAVTHTGGIGCTSAPYSVTILDKSVNPTVSLTPVGNTACDNGYDGSIQVNLTTASGPGQTVTVGNPTYAYTWVSGTTTTPANSVGQPSNNNYTGRQDGNYTLTAKNEITGCVVSQGTTVDKAAPPVFTLSTSKTPQTQCTPTNGSITVTDVQIDVGAGPVPDGTANFTYQWYKNAPNTPQLQDGAFVNISAVTLDNTNYSTIGAGSYFVVAQRKNGVPKGSGCTSAPVNVNILDQRTYPNATLTPLSNTACSGAFEGSVTANVTDVSAGTFSFGFTFTSSTDPTVVNPLVVGPFTGGTNYTYGLLEQGDYTLTATNATSGCFGTAIATVVKDVIPVFVNTFQITDQFYCDNSGHVQISDVSYKDRTGAIIHDSPTKFTYAWAPVGGATIVTATTQVLDSMSYSSIKAGLYQVIATRKATFAPGQGCSSAPVNVEIKDKTQLPKPVLTPFSDTSCTGPAEGELQVDVTDASVAKVSPPALASGPPWSYDYTWSDPNAAGLTLPAPNPDPGKNGIANKYIGLQAGTYRIDVKNTATNCTAFAIGTIIKNATPVFVNAPKVHDQFVCINSGNIEIQSITYKDRLGNPISAPVPDFTFAWTRTSVGSVGTGAARIDSIAYPGINAAVYSVTATRTANSPGNGCTSAPINIEIQNKSVNPVPVLTVFANTSCDPAAPGEGEIVINTTDATINAYKPVTGFTYSYAWSGGDPQTLPGTLPYTSPAAAQQGNGNGVNGDFAGDIDDYKLLLNSATPYSILVTNNQSGCSSTATATIVKNAVPVFVQTVTSLPQILCDLVNGDGLLKVEKVSVNERSGSSPISHDYVPGGGAYDIADFHFDWSRTMSGYTQNTAGNVLANATPPALSAGDVYKNAGGFGIPIGADTYTVVATRINGSPGRGCPSAPFSVVIKNERINPVVALTPFSNTSCDSNAPEGEISVKVTDANSTAHPALLPLGGFTYNYEWTIVPASSQTLLWPLPGGSASNIKTNNDGDGFGGGEPDGGIAGNPADNDNDHPTGLDNGNYAVTVTNPFTLCSTSTPTVVPVNQIPVIVQSVKPTDAIICFPDGKLTVTQVTISTSSGPQIFDQNTPTALQNLLTDFQFEWTRVGDANAYTETTNGAAAPAGAELNKTTYVIGAPGTGFAAAFGPDTYTVVARRKTGSPGKNCASAPYTVLLQDKSIKPVVTLKPFANTACSGAFEGEIEVTVSDNSVVAPAPNFQYTYDWTLSATPLVINGPVYDPIAGAPTLQLQNGDVNDGGTTGGNPDGDGDNPINLQDGDYTLAVVNTTTGCTATGSTTIYKNSTPVFTQLVTASDMFACYNSGHLVVDSVKVIDRTGKPRKSGIDFPISDFKFTYDYNTIGGTVLGPFVAATRLDSINYNAIQFGTYFVTAKRTNSGPGFGCASAPYKVDILDKRIFPSPSLTPLANTSCDPTFFEGEIKVAVTDGNKTAKPAGGIFKFDYNWTVVPVNSQPVLWPAPGGSATIFSGNDGDGFGGGEPDGGIVGNPPDNDSDHPKALDQGDYTVMVTNSTSGCSTPGQTTIFRNSTPVFTQLVTSVPQIFCKPSGHLTVREVQIIDRNGNIQSNLPQTPKPPLPPLPLIPPAFPLSDFVFKYERTTIGNVIVASNDPSQPVLQLDSLSYPSVPNNLFDTYYVTATRVNGFPGKNCSSAPYRVDIDDRRIYPTLQFGSEANSSCNVAKPNGSVQATAAEPNGSQVGPYTFSWTLNGTAVASVVPAPPTQNDVGPVSTLTNALDGAYIATVTNTSTGCPFDGSFNLLLDQTRSTPNIIDVATIDPIDCNPTAGAQVTKITLGSTFNSSLQPPQIPPDNTVTGALLGPPRFVYTWYEGSITNPLAFTTLPCIGPNCATPTIGLLSGDHFVTVTDSKTDCQSGPKEFQIKTDNIIYPVASLTQTKKQISCIPTIGTGELQVTASEQDGTTGTSYTFTWYPSLDETGTAFGPPTAPSATNNPNLLQQLVVGNYSVLVKNNITSCTANALFIVPDDSPLFVPALSTGTTPQTFCVGTDGDAQVRILLDPSYPLVPYDNTSFTTDLYKGANPDLSTAPDVQANIPFTATGSPTTITYDVPGLATGFYTFKVTDKNTGCVRTDSVNIKLQQKKPVIAIVQDNPMKNCDPLIADGQLAATADGQIQGYTFDWYKGIAASGSILQTDNKLIGQRAGQYTVRATVNVTGCFTDKTGHIDSATVIPPVPIAITLHNQSNCVTPNGEVTATVGGVVLGYSFQWYNGQYTDNAKLPSTVDFKFADYTGLDVGYYSVTATDDVTHCISPPASTQVIDIRVLPAFTVDSTPSYCTDTGKPKGNGSFTLTSEANVAYSEIKWTLAGDTTNVQGMGPYVNELWPGDYHVLVTTYEGCERSANYSIITEIKPYNLVSTNNDGQNDAFIIDCISNYPNNNVKIFNRNGTMVYEADGYDNTSKFFRGVGEKGVYLSDKELPEGTYFYIIDKRNGTKPKSGFIELVR